MKYLLIALAVLMVIVVGVMVGIAEKIIKGRKDD